MANNADIKFNVDNLELFYGNFKALKGIDMEIKKNEMQTFALLCKVCGSTKIVNKI